MATCASLDFSDWDALTQYEGIDAPIVKGSSVERLTAAVAAASFESGEPGAALADLVNRNLQLFDSGMKVIKESIEPAKIEGERYKQQKGEIYSPITVYTLDSMRKTYQDVENDAVTKRAHRTVAPGTVAHAATSAAESITATSAVITAEASALASALTGSASSKARLVGTMAFELAADARHLAIEIRQSADFKTESEWDSSDQSRIASALRHCWCLSPGSDDKPLLLCSRCLNAKYCCVSCQKKAWPSHKPLCTKYAAASAPPTPFPPT